MGLEKGQTIDHQYRERRGWTTVPLHTNFCPQMGDQKYKNATLNPILGRKN